MDNYQIDLGKIYGLTGCPEGGCVYTGDIIPNVPSLEQIAAYNAAQQYLTPTGPARPEFATGAQTLQQTLQAAQQQAAREQASISGSTPIPSQTRPPMSSQMQTTTPALISEQAAMPPAGMPAGMPTGMQAAMNEFAPIPEFNQPYPITGESIQYLNGFLRTQIGRRCEIQILVGTDNLVTKDGYLLGIGANYILINEIGTSDLTTCDFYNIKFVRFMYD